MTITVDWFIEATLGLDFVAAGTTTRALAVSNIKSQPPWNNLNLGLHVGDNAETVNANRLLINNELELPSKPFWLEQVHGVEVVEAYQNTQKPVVADASFTTRRGLVLAVMTADCLPLILASESADWIAVVHCGWRSLSAGIITNTLSKTTTQPGKIRAWMGPAIGASVFEVAEDVKDSFLKQATLKPTKNQNPLIPEELVNHCFTPTPRGKYLANLPALVSLQLSSLGVEWIKGGEYCTYSDSQQFFSYRRDGQTGRMATLAWIK